MNPTATLVVTVPEGECWTNCCPFNYDGAVRQTYQHCGKLRKRGAGTLELTTSFRYSNGGTYNTDYCSTLAADEGTLVLPQKAPNKAVFYAHELTVSNGATLVTCIGNTTYPCLISGSGTITNRSDSVQTLFLVGWSQNAAQHIAALRDFSGTIAGHIGIQSSQRLNLTGEGSTFDGGLGVMNNSGWLSRWNGTVGVRKFGMKGDGASSVGTASSLNMGYNGGCPGGGYLMLNDAPQTTDKDFIMYVRDTSSPIFFDAGAYGGAEFTGNFTRPAASAGSMETFQNLKLFWLGSNTEHECVYRGALKEQPVKGTNYMMHITKRGTGIWHLADQPAVTRIPNEERNGLSAVTVEQGTFRFDSITRKGDFCSLGRGTNPMESYQGYMDTNKVVDWTFALGTSTTEGTLEYVGTDNANAYTRPIVFRGNARLVNSTNAYIRYRALPPEGAGAKTLTLDGTCTLESEISDVTDTAAAPVSVVKKGAGKWVLGGNLTFHGGIDVQGGELVVRKYPQRYSWFKWLIKENSITDAAPTAGQILQASIFALYDENQVCRNIGLQQVTNSACVLQPGQATFEANRYYTELHGASYRPMRSLFMDYCGGYGMYIIPYKADRSGALRTTRDNPDSWVPIVMRLADGSPDIVGYDYVEYYGTTSGDRAGSNRSICAYTVEGSPDGIHWDDLTGDVFIPPTDMPTANFCWVSGGTANKKCGIGEAAQHKSNGSAYALPESFKFTRTKPDAFAVLNNVGAVKVAGGAKLTADGEGITLSRLSVDATGVGTGTVDGFTFAANGTLDVTGLAASGDVVELPLRVINAPGLENVQRWSLVRNGVADTSRWIAVRGDRLLICPKGTALYFR